MKNSEIKELGIKELTEKISEEKLNLDRKKFNHSVSPLENPMAIRQMRRLIARLQTELNSRKSKGE